METELGPLIIAGIIALFVLVMAMKGFRIVKQAEVMIIERLGKYSKTIESGINIIWPIIDQPRRYIHDRIDIEGYRESSTERIDLRERVFDFPKQNVITKDNVNVQINALLYFQILDPVKAVYEIVNLPDAIEKLTQTTLRNVVGELELDQTLAARDTINSKLQGILDDATNKWGVKVNRVELQDISPPHEIQEAMNKQMFAERERRARVLEAQGLKTSSILEAEGIKESEIQKAIGLKESEILIAEGLAQAKISIAQAEAESIRLISEEVGKKGDPMQYLVAVKYIETLEKMVGGKDTKTIYMPYEATGVLSSLGGIKELFNTTNN